MKNIFIITACISLCLISYVGFIVLDQQPGKFKVAFLDVGQGDAIFIQTPEKYQILIDTGATSVVTSELGSVMMPWDRSIDLVIITHPDSDHFGAVEDIVRQYRIDTIVDNGFYNQEEFLDYKKLVDREGSQRVVPSDGYVLSISDETKITFLSVPGHGEHGDKNEESIILRVDHRGASFLLTGDAGTETEEGLIKNHSELLDVDVLKLGHHGSKTSTSEEFLRATKPQMAIVSAGLGNRYGHPHDIVTQRLEEFDIQQFCTCDEGRIIFKWKEDRLMLKL